LRKEREVDFQTNKKKQKNKQKNKRKKNKTTTTTTKRSRMMVNAMQRVGEEKWMVSTGSGGHLAV